MRKTFYALIILIFFAGVNYPVYAKNNEITPQELNRAITLTSAYLQVNVRNPQVGSVGGEWTVLGLARSERAVPDLYFRRYFRTVEAYVKERNGVLDERRFTEYSRVILALTAAGFNPRNVAGYDLTLPLGDFEGTMRQGINGAIFALLALDSLEYESPARELFIEEILRLQNPDGGWSLTGETGDPDITAMALQALAKYRENSAVDSAAEHALTFLSDIQNENGGFTGLESSVQVLVALTELEIPINDSRFIKNGNLILNYVLGFQNSNGSFRRDMKGTNTDGNLMSTEIGFYGLVAAQRSINDRNSLYRMCDRRVR
ncbi:MAG: terpene cyclase/mutase family protein [Defluviitaleaceae bacterium]|nr:terpene cyclase/mutase family protein [Defluviitaleaceae bacterium]